MGAILSKVRLTFETFRDLAAKYNEVDKRLSSSPGLPLPNPTTPFWAVPPSPLADHGAENPLPQYSDVVIIGSGIAGTSFARHFLDQSDGSSVTMLDARAVCSGATARNGGHITPELYHEYQALEKSFGTEAAKAIIRFRRAHLPEFMRVAEEEGILEYSQCRQVDTYDAFLDPTLFENMKAKLQYFLEAFPEEQGKWVVRERSTFGELQLSDDICGVIETKGGAVHPYRLVTGVLTRLLKSYPLFNIHSHTPVTGIEAKSGAYFVSTPRGTIRAKHVIHATNAWSSHLLAPMRRKIIPFRGHMTAQRPGNGLGQPELPDTSSQLTISSGWLGTRSFVLYPSTSEERYDYLTQQPVDSQDAFGAKPQGEFMFGGGMEAGGPAFFDSIGASDDGVLHFPSVAYLSGALAAYFGSWWGSESTDIDEGFDAGRVKKVWTGVLGMSADRIPWVGKLTKKISGRPVMGDGGEWIAAGFTGEGMTHAWLSGKALALFVLGRDEDCYPWFPRVFRVTEKRWRSARIEDSI